jgi:uncharacterized protein involved in response to NO
MISWLSLIAGEIQYLIKIAFSVDLNGMEYLVSSLLGVVFMGLSVGQRMIPFFSHVMIQKDIKLLPTIYLLSTLYIVLAFFDIKISPLFLVIAGAIFLRELFRWRLPTLNSQPILWILHISIYWFAIGAIVGGVIELYGEIFDKNFLKLSLHLLLIGFMATVLIGFATRVTLGHSGNLMVTDNYVKILFYLTQIILYFRSLYSFTATLFIFDITAFLWMALFIGWGFKFFLVLFYGKRIT